MQQFVNLIVFLGLCGISCLVIAAIIPFTRKKFLMKPKPRHYEKAEQEVLNGTFQHGIWAKALVNTMGNEELRKVEYVKLRAKQLQEEE